MLSSELLSRDGFLIMDGFLTPSAVGEIVAFLEGLQFDQEASRVRRGVVFARRNLLGLDFIRGLVQRREIVEMVKALAPESAAVRAILFDKTGAANWTVPWHQDRAIAVRERIDAPGFGPWSQKAGVIHVQPPTTILRQMLTLRIHADACRCDNGPLRVIAGTHNRLMDPREIAAETEEAKQFKCEVDAGGLVVMRPLVLHASSPAKAPGHRRVIHVEFGPERLPGGLEWAVA